MRGILLAGGTGSRLWPLTRAVSKQLLPVFDKPMIYYPLTTLIMAGIREVLVITTPQDQEQFQRLLGDGSQWGIELALRGPGAPRGIAQAFVLGADFIGERLGGAGPRRQHLPRQRPRHPAVRERGALVGGRIFAYPVADPRRWAWSSSTTTAEVGLHRGEARAAPSPATPSPGCTSTTTAWSRSPAALKPSARGELEITAVNDAYLRPRRAPG